jgi:hypothetical protein
MCDSATAQAIEFGTAVAPPLSGTTGWYYNTDACRVFLNTAKPASEAAPVAPEKPPTPRAPVTPTKTIAPAEIATPVKAEPVVAPAAPATKRPPLASPAE